MQCAWKGRGHAVALAILPWIASATACRSSKPAVPEAGACTPLLGGCVALAVAEAHCGGLLRPGQKDEGCVEREPCGRGRARELTTGECLARRDVRGLASEIGLVAGEEEELACEGGELVASISSEGVGLRRLGCIARPTRVPTKEAIPFERGRLVDVTRWAAEVLGADGGPAAKPLCDALTRSPGVLASSSSEVRAEIGLTFPDNDVSQVIVRSRLLAPEAGIPPIEAARELERVLAPMIEALRSLGGTAPATAATLLTRVKCRRSSTRPIVKISRP